MKLHSVMFLLTKIDSIKYRKNIKIMDEGKDQQTEQKAFVWSSKDLASYYEKQMQLTGGLVEVTRRLIETAGIREGFQVLDLTAGTGEQSIPAARAAGSTGTILATDVSSDMLEKVELFAEREGLTNIKTQVMNAEHLTLADQTFDAVISRFGLDFLNYHKVLSEALRVLRPKRKMAALIWSTPDRHLLSSILVTIIQKYVAMPSVPHALADPGAFEQAFKQAGFSEISVQHLPIHLQFHSLETFFEFYIYPPARMSAALGQLSQEDQQRVLEEVRQAMQQFQRPDGTLALPSEVILGVGTRRE